MSSGKQNQHQQRQNIESDSNFQIYNYFEQHLTPEKNLQSFNLFKKKAHQQNM